MLLHCLPSSSEDGVPAQAALETTALEPRSDGTSINPVEAEAMPETACVNPISLESQTSENAPRIEANPFEVEDPLTEAESEDELATPEEFEMEDHLTEPSLATRTEEGGIRSRLAAVLVNELTRQLEAQLGQWVNVHTIPLGFWRPPATEGGNDDEEDPEDPSGVYSVGFAFSPLNQE